MTLGLQEASRDKHLAVYFSLEPLPDDLPTSPPAVPIQPQPVSEAQKQLLGAFWRNESCSFANAAVLLGNVGYLKFNAFPSPRVCSPERHAPGSNQRDGPVLDDSHRAWTAVRRQARVRADFAPHLFGGPKFAYNLKMLGRATIVGERSGGGAHGALSLRIDSHCHVSIPFARSINPISRTNWEGKGVEPDIGVRESVAVHAAHRAALEGVLKQALSATHREAVRRHIEALTTILQSKE